MSSCATPFLAVGAAVLWATAGAQSPSAADIKNLKCELTIFAGRVVYQDAAAAIAIRK